MLERSLLGLVARGASLGELRSQFESAASRMRGPERAEAESSLALAMNLHDEIEELRRRSHEIETLILTVADVTALRDLDGALQAICARARALLAADVAWLRVVDPSRTYDREFAADGALTAEFNAMDFHHSAGMSGRVVAERRARATEDYLTDTTFEHSEDFDRAFAAEGVRAVVCVPLRRGERIVGVLLAGSRTHRVFTQRDINQLEILSAHAGIVLENGRLFDEAQRALVELREAEQRTRLHALELERSFELDEELMRLVVEGASLQKVCDTVASTLGGSLAVFDRQVRILAVAGGPADAIDELLEGDASTRRIEAVPELWGVVRQVRDTGVMSVLDGDGATVPRVVCPMHAGDETLGELVFAATDALELKPLLIRVTTVLSLVMVHARDLEAAESRSRDVLMNDLLGNSPADPEGLVRRAGRLGLDLDQPLGVYVLALGDDAPARVLAGISRLAADTSGLAAEFQDRLVLLLPGTDIKAGLRSIQEAIPPQSATIGAAGPTTGLGELVERFEEARRTLGLLRGLGRSGVAATVDDLGFFGVVLPHADTRQIERFIQDTLGPLCAYDAERGTDLLGTLAEYFECGGHLAETAASLHVHINTLYQRLDRVAGLLGADWRDSDKSLQLHLASRLHQISRAIEQ